MVDINLKNVQHTDLTSMGRGVTFARKASEMYGLSTKLTDADKAGLAANDDAVVQTSALYVVTPDGVMHVKKTNADGAVDYSPSITIQSYYKQTKE